MNLPNDYDIAHDDDDYDVDDNEYSFDGQINNSSFHVFQDQYVKGYLKMNNLVKNKMQTLVSNNKKLQESTLPDVNIHYLYLIDNLCKLLESCDPGVFIDKCASLMASYHYNISLFNDKVLKEFGECHNVPVMLRYLMCYCTWCDLSVVLKLLEICDYPDGVRLLQKFKHIVDYTKPITQYPITNPDSLMIPSENSPYTVMVTKYESVNFPLSLRQIEMIKSLITEKCEITFISCQFLSTANGFQDFYWLIPKNVGQFIVDKVQKSSSYLHEIGMKELSIYPYNDGDNRKFVFVTGSTVKVRYQYHNTV